LGVAPKDLQNLVQFKVLRPIRRDNFYWFDNRLLLEAKISKGVPRHASTGVLARFTHALSSLKDEEMRRTRYSSLQSRPSRDRNPVAIQISLAGHVKELQEQLPLASVYQDLPRGRKRAGWKREFERSMEMAA
jgi:hypothetical protein